MDSFNESIAGGSVTLIQPDGVAPPGCSVGGSAQQAAGVRLAANRIPCARRWLAVWCVSRARLQAVWRC